MAVGAVDAGAAVVPDGSFEIRTSPPEAFRPMKKPQRNPMNKTVISNKAKMPCFFIVLRPPPMLTAAG